MGELKRKMLKLAAICGHQAACKALGDYVPATPEELIIFLDEGLDAWGKEACDRAAIASAILVLRVSERAFPDDPRPSQAIQAAIAWLACPCESHQQAAEAAAEAVYEVFASCSAEAAFASAMATGAAQEQSSEQAICEALISWALGYPDPLLDSNDEDNPPSD